MLMLEGKIIVYSHLSSRVSNFIYGLLSLFPGLISFKYLNSEGVGNYMKSIMAFGFPL
jgi:hypothetical protein